jgi:uncharacterized integral membrane protein
MALLHRDRTDHDLDHDRDVDHVRATDTVTGPAETRVVRKNSFGHTLATILATLILAAVVVVALVNTDQTDVDLVFERYDLPLSALVGGAAGAGLLIGLLLGARRRASTR